MLLRGKMKLALIELRKGISVAVWTRPEVPLVTQYYVDVFKSLVMGIRGVFSITSLKEEIAKLLPSSSANVKVSATGKGSEIPVDSITR